ncbi:hypothetical protein [Shimia sp.]|uniref:hypothetical protein n=1 Tax=Shimia sp. TaxID=1954381 RepID=UPI003BAD324D
MRLFEENHLMAKCSASNLKEIRSSCEGSLVVELEDKTLSFTLEETKEIAKVLLENFELQTVTQVVRK